MAVKDRHNGKYDVELKGKHVKRLYDADAANMLYYSGKRLLELGKPLDAVIAELRGESTDTPTLDEYFESWLPLHSIQPVSVTSYKASYKRLSEQYGHLRLDQAVEPAVLKRMVQTLRERGYSTHTVQDTMSTIKAMLNDACDDRLISNRPPRRIKNQPRVTRIREPYALTREQHKGIVASSERYRYLFALWPLIGGRRGEMLELRWTDREGKAIWIRRQRRADGTIGPPKYGSIRRIDLCDEANRLLDEWQQLNPCDLIFPGSNGRHLGRTLLDKGIKDAGKAVGLELRSHIFRHTAGSWWIASRAFSLPAVARMMGHRIEELTKTYTHEIEETDRGALARYDAWLRGTEGTETEKRRSEP